VSNSVLTFSLADAPSGDANPLGDLELLKGSGVLPESLQLELEPSRNGSHLFERNSSGSWSPVREPIRLALQLDRSDSTTPVYKASLASDLRLRTNELGVTDLHATDLRATALIELPEARSLLGMEAAAALDLHHGNLISSADQGLVRLRDIDITANAAGSLRLQVDDLLNFLLAGNPIGSTVDAINDAIDAVTEAVDGALCGLDDGALTPANWLAMLTGLADRIEDLGDALVGNLAGDPVISGIAAQLGFDFADLGAGFTTVADTVRSFTDHILPPDEWANRFNQAMDDAGLGDITLTLVHSASPDAFAGECPDHDPAVRTPLLYLFELDFGDGLDWSAGGQDSSLIALINDMAGINIPTEALNIQADWSIGIDVDARLGFGFDLDARSAGEFLVLDTAPGGTPFTLPAGLDGSAFAQLNASGTELFARAWLDVSDLQVSLAGLTARSEAGESLLQAGIAAGVDLRIEGSNGSSYLPAELIDIGHAISGGAMDLAMGFDADVQFHPELLLRLAEQLGDAALATLEPFENAYADGVQSIEDVGDLLNCSGFGLQQVLFILAQLEQTVDNLQHAIEAGVADNPLMATFAPDLGADIKQFTGGFDLAEQALADLRGLGEQVLPWNLIPRIDALLPDFLNLELQARPIFDAYFCVANSGDKQIRLDSSARYNNASAGGITYTLPDDFDLEGQDRTTHIVLGASDTIKLPDGYRLVDPAGTSSDFATPFTVLQRLDASSGHEHLLILEGLNGSNPAAAGKIRQLNGSTRSFSGNAVATQLGSFERLGTSSAGRLTALNHYLSDVRSDVNRLGEYAPDYYRFALSLDGLAASIDLDFKTSLGEKQTTAWRQNTRRLANGARRIVEIMQHLMHDREISGITLHRQRIHIALSQLHIVKAGFLQPTARDGEHGGRQIDANGALRMWRKNFEHPTGAGAKIDKTPHRPRANRFAHSVFDQRLRHMPRTNVVPLGGVGGEVTGGGFGASVAHLGKAQAIFSQHSIIGIEPADDIAGQRARTRRSGETEKRPGALAAAFDEPGLDQQLEMAGNARLRLTEDGHHLADGELRLGQKREKTQTRLLTGGVEPRQHRVHSEDFLRSHPASHYRYKDIYMRCLTGIGSGSILSSYRSRLKHLARRNCSGGTSRRSAVSGHVDELPCRRRSRSNEVARGA